MFILLVIGGNSGKYWIGGFKKIYFDIFDIF